MNRAALRNTPFGVQDEIVCSKSMTRFLVDRKHRTILQVLQMSAAIPHPFRRVQILHDLSISRRLYPHRPLKHWM